MSIDYLFKDEERPSPPFLKADYQAVLSTPSGRRVLRDILSFFKVGQIFAEGLQVYANAAVHDAASNLESQFWSFDPNGWAKALKEEIDEWRNAPKEE